MPAPSENDYKRWQKKFNASCSHVHDRAFRSLCRAGCDPEELYQDLWGYSHFKLNRTRLESTAERIKRWTRRYRTLALTLRAAAVEFEAVKHVDECGIASYLDKHLWEGFQAKAALTSGLLIFTAHHWERRSTRRALASNDFLLAFLCEYVKCATGRPRHKEIALLLDAAWIAKGEMKDWNSDMLQSKLQRIPMFTKNLAASIAQTILKNHRQNPPKK